MSFRKLRVSIVVVVAVLMNGCASFSTLQTAEAVPVGITRVNASIGGIYHHPQHLENSGYPTYFSDGAALLGELDVRHGIRRHFDMGGKIYSGGFEGGMKYHFLRGGFDLSVAPGIGLTLYEGYVNTNLIAGVDLGSEADVLFGLKFDTRGPLRSSDQGLSGTWLGGFVGLSVFAGDNVSSGFEINVLTDVSEPLFDRTIVQGGIAFWVDFGKGEPLYFY